MLLSLGAQNISHNHFPRIKADAITNRRIRTPIISRVSEFATAFEVGAGDGAMVGLKVGSKEGTWLGDSEGTVLGAVVGESVGRALGSSVAVNVGA